MHKIETIAILVSCVLGLYIIAEHRIPNQQPKVESVSFHAVARSYNNGLKIKEVSDCIIPKISKELENQIKQELKEIEKQQAIKQKKIQYDKDLYLLAQVIYAEAGSDWISDEVQLMVANVVINRVDSNNFSHTIYDVVHAPNQYQFIKHNIIIKPNKRALNNAKKVLDGLRVLPKNVTYQSEYKHLGDGIYKKVKTKYSTMYFSYSK